MKKNVLFLMVIAGLFMASCNQNKSKTPEQLKNEVVGIYHGTLPCADCSGIQQTLTLNNDDSYVMERVYMGKGDGTPYTDRGTYRIENERVILSGITDAPSDYKIHEGSLEQMDMSGNKVDSDFDYRLYKR